MRDPGCLMRVVKPSEDAVEIRPRAWRQIVREVVHESADMEIAEDHGLLQVLARIERERHPAPEVSAWSNATSAPPDSISGHVQR
jgi:hypothetical protein